MVGPRILIARAEPDASQTAVTVGKMGGEAILAPMRVAHPNESPAPARPDGVLATSARAFALGAPLPEDWLKLPCLVVGDITGEAARMAGFSDLRIAQGEAASMAREMAGFAGKNIVYLAGFPRRPELEIAAQALGVDLVPWLRYRMDDVSQLPEAARAALTEGRCDAILHFSRESVASLVRLVTAAGLTDRLQKPLHGCLSPAIAEEVKARLADSTSGVEIVTAAKRKAETLIEITIDQCRIRSSRESN